MTQPAPPLEPKSQAASPESLRRVNNIPSFGSIRTIYALILREMSTTYGRSPGGYIWAIAEPVLAIGVMVAIFSAGFRSPRLGTNFPIFYASGFLVFFCYSNPANVVSQAVNFSRQLLAYPRVTYLDAIVARFVLALLTQLLVSYIIFLIILMTMDTRTVLQLTYLLSAYSMAATLALGIGVLNCVLISRYPFWQPIWSVINRPLVLISGVIFIPESIPQPYRDYLSWNPLVHVVSEARKAFYPTYTADYISHTYVYSIALVCLVVGLSLLRRTFRDSMER
ncbi:ABC transporter permease [Planktotalea sp.]|uniref:ABC transporter permease n=1 Tax=Planktotalea sp. TaxID=2029877 RepID=UPI0032991A58